MSRSLIWRVAIGVLSLSTMGLGAPALANPAGTGLVISEAYVNGGSSGASFVNKFIELYNPTSSTVSLAGDTLQYRAPTSTVVPSGSQVFALSGTVAAHGHFLIQLPSNGHRRRGAAAPRPQHRRQRQPGRGRRHALRRVERHRRPAHRRRGHRQDRLGHQQLARGHRGDRQLRHAELPAQRHRQRTPTTTPPTSRWPHRHHRTRGGRLPPTVTVSDPGTQNATVGTAIAPLTLTATGGTSPYAWSATGLPAGLAISEAGVVSGTPTATGASTVTVTATDSTGASGSATFTFQVAAAPTVVSIAEIQGTNTDTSPYAGQTVTTDGRRHRGLPGRRLQRLLPGDRGSRRHAGGRRDTGRLGRGIRLRVDLGGPGHRR